MAKTKKDFPPERLYVEEDQVDNEMLMANDDQVNACTKIEDLQDGRVFVYIFEEVKTLTTQREFK